ncbi:CBM35 domain-containing protein [Streptomyces sp. NPDC001568]|uniref:CBM35 domain-containing protein n=1 Tax=Streptomyces sp. NPDC001568 TaxID=3364588 RepID=UPI0036877272
MTTPANNGPHGGANQPEDDDPFGYLYADGQAAGATPPGSGGGYGYPGPAGGGQPGVQPGVPRTSYNQVRTVGERTYGGQRGPVPAQQQPYQAQYQAPEALQAGGYGVPQQPSPQDRTQTIQPPGGGAGRGNGGGSSRKGLLIAAVAVVAAVAIGIGAALAFGKDDDKKDQANPDPAQSAAPQPQVSNSPKASASSQPPAAPLPKGEAAGAGMALTGGAVLQTTIPGSKSSGGQYVGNFNQPGAALTWTLELPKGGVYRYYVRFGIPGEDANATLTVNGKANTTPLNMRNFANSPKGDWEKGWQTTWGQVNLNKGTNTIKLSCESGNKCNVNIDQLWLEQG